MPTSRAQLWRAAAHGEKAAAFEALARAVRDLAAVALRRFRIPAADREDMAQDVATRVLSHISDGTVRPGNETTYTRTAARNAGNDWFRKHRSAPVLAEIDELDKHANNPISDDNAPFPQWMLDALQVVLANAPPAYAACLKAVHIQGREIGELVDDELATRIANGSLSPPVTERDRKRARDCIDNRLRNARNWVRARILDEKTRGQR